jgi:hypothetical protein
MHGVRLRFFDAIFERTTPMILLTQRLGLFSFLLLSCFALGCGQQQETNKLIDEINAARVKAQTLVEQAEAKRTEAKKKFDNGDRPEGEKRIEEAANIYGQIAELLNQSADKAEQITKLNNPEWYKDYFTLQSKLIRNLAGYAGGAREELLVRKSGKPSDDQLKAWEEGINKRSKENEKLRKEIAKIESEHGTVLIKHD